MMAIVVCGGRYYNEKASVYAALDSLHRKHPIGIVVDGDQTGADTLGRQWAIDRGISHKTYHAYFAGIGPSAGPMRNGQMLKSIAETARQPGWRAGVVAFPGGVGTANCTAQASRMGIQVWRPFG